MERRDFIKISGAGALALGAAAVGCAPKKKTAPAAAAEEGPEQMVYRENPVNGDKVSLIGFGCMRWPMVEKDGKRVIDQEAVNEMVDYALEHGINYFDTSPAYLMGQSEKAAGIALSRHPRDKYFIATKLSNFNNQTPEASIQMYRDSFDQLKTDYFDYYLLHSIGSGGVEAFRKRYVDNGMMEFLIKEKEAGRIRNLGFSFHGSPSDFDSLIALHDNGEYHWDFVQIEMNYVDWNHADGRRNANASYLYEELDKRGIPIVIMEPLLGGRLANVPDAIAQQMKEREPDKSIASWAFRFCGTHPRVLCALSGMTNMDPLLDNIKTFTHFKPLNEEELEFMERMATQMMEYPTVNCTDCKYCMPCPWGIDIPGIFKHYNTSVTEGRYAQTREQEDYRKLKRAYLVSYDRAIPTLRQADHCIHCGECLSHCPQSIPIPRELQRINRYIEKLKQDTL
ncbi:MAG: aldo/keto reductase [Bacteroidales bacterium]|nr:aldo/keto reductase [Bacteroidales bacterium]MBR6864458.1 aldo/keto reductase [Bacteroidales bacterium]